MTAKLQPKELHDVFVLLALFDKAGGHIDIQELPSLSEDSLDELLQLSRLLGDWRQLSRPLADWLQNSER